MDTAIKLSTVAVIRDTSTGACYLTTPYKDRRIDEDRLSEAGLELAGWLMHAEQASTKYDDFADTEEEAEDQGKIFYQGPQFSTCMFEDCQAMIVLIDDSAPYHCTEHEGLEEK